ncbi:hypothetical protein BJY01DRAFT_251444 [Aspergillus pseudoustus]|uniref:Peptidase A2 domain-containing protein n=1 Tax=Aspergillus pseudoustus TaxID=1810923 RepID=A0ABR4JC10_9EURO
MEAESWIFTDNSLIPRARQTAHKGSRIPTASRRYFLEGDVNGRQVEALPDTGADICFISPELACRLDLAPAARTQRKIQLANRKHVQSPGMANVPCRFASEQEKTHVLGCWILPGCVHDLILGNQSLKITQTLTKFKSRIKSKLVDARAYNFWARRNSAYGDP